ncbi:MAG: DUF2723 domain-containing protein [Chloroflexi bacterium]|nr:DUF2723 domain-containing protein [Chloroflexota bacterium]
MMELQSAQSAPQSAPTWLWTVSGSAVGLFLARVALEATRRPWPWFLVVVVGLLAALGGLALGRWTARRRVRLWPAPLLLAYVLWPWRDPVIAAGVATLAALLWLFSHEKPSLPHWIEPLADGATFVIALIAYTATVAPDVLPADAGEFQLAAALLGVAHPPGYPLYTMMGHLFIRLVPWGTPAYRLNLMSGLLAAGTLVLVARATRLWAQRLGASPLMVIAEGLAASLTLGTATTFWAQSTIANVRTLAVFFAALALYFLSRFATATDSGESDRALVFLASSLGLGGGHYPPLAFVSIFFVIYVLLTDPPLLKQPRRWWRPLLVGLAGLILPLAYLPIRGAMDAPLAPDGLNTWSGFLHHFLALGFGGDMFAFATAADLPNRLALLPTLFPFQFNLVLLAAALFAFIGLVWRDWQLFVLMAGSLVLHTFVSITYRAPQTVEYLMPAYLPIAIAVGLLPALVGGLRQKFAFVRPGLAAVVLCAGLFNGWAHASSFVELASDHTARQAVEPLLKTAPANALILADWRWAMPLRYLREVEGIRPDVQVQYVYPIAGKEYPDVWLDWVQGADAERPVLLTHSYTFDGYTTEPWAAGFMIRPHPVTEPAASLISTAATFGERVQLLGYNLRQQQFHPGQLAEFVLAWQPTESLGQTSFTLRLVDAEGNQQAQVDRSLPTGALPGQVRFTRLALPLYPTLPPGRYRVTLGAYTVTDAGFENLLTAQGEVATTLTELEITPHSRPPFTLHRETVPFDGGPTLVGVDYDWSAPDVLRIYLHWRGGSREALHAQVAAGNIVGAASLPLVPESAYQTIIVDMPLPRAAATSLRLSLTDELGRTKTALGLWSWPMQQVRLPTPAQDTRFVPLGDEMAVIGVKAHSVGSGETMAVDVTLVALRPLTSDDGTSVRLKAADGRWLGTHDSQPALGAIPTLKWIRGSRVVDRHLLQIPQDSAVGEVWATFVAYERFRMTPLPSMDTRFGEIPLGQITLP